MTKKWAHMCFHFPFQLQIMAATERLALCKLTSSIIHTYSPRKHIASIYTSALINSPQGLMLFVKYESTTSNRDSPMLSNNSSPFSAVTMQNSVNCNTFLFKCTFQIYFVPFFFTAGCCPVSGLDVLIEHQMQTLDNEHL